MGTALQNFNDFMTTTGPRYMTSAGKLINEAAKHTYILSRFLRGRGMERVIQGGTKIKDVLMFDEQNTYGHYHPNDTVTWENPQFTEDIEVPWRYSYDHMAWTDQEIEHNIPDSMSREAQKVQYKNLKKAKEMRMWTSMINGMEDDLWKDADNQQAAMESASGKQQYSIPAFITENTTNYHPTGWTTIQGVDPATESKWRNQVSTYDYDDPDDTDNDRDGLLDAFQEMFYKVRFIPPSTKRQYFENARLNRQFICCSRGGINLYQNMLRASNDSLVSKQDPAYLNPTFGGIELVYVAALDTATIFGGATELNASTDGYRYWWLNGNYITPVYHRNRYIHKKDPMNHINQPWSWVCPVDCWWNLFLNSRQRQGIIAPQ